MTAAAVLITGGTGYLGQFLCRHFAQSGCEVGLTYRSATLPELPSNVQAFKVDLASGEGLDECLATLTAGGRQLVAVINCAAISQPALCEKDPMGAAAVNVPTQLIDALERWQSQRQAAAESTTPDADAAATADAAQVQQVEEQQQQQAQQAQQQDGKIVRLLSKLSEGLHLTRRSGGSGSGRGGSSERGSLDDGQADSKGGEAEERQPLFVQLSTDQVYDGSRAGWREEDSTGPINAYGRTKLAGEWEVRERWPNHAILRSSLIYGPDPPLQPVPRPLFLQFVDSALAGKRPTEFYSDEWRCPIRVRDIVRVIQTLIFKQEELQHRLFNMGGPDRLSRADMALAVAEAHGYDPSLVLAVPAPPAATRGVPSPADISMHSCRLEAELQLPLTPFRTALGHIFSEHEHQ